MLQMPLPAKCPVCLGKHLARYRLYHDCQMSGRPVGGIRITRTKQQTRCSLCGAPGAVTLVYCAGCRTMWVEQGPATRPLKPVLPTPAATPSAIQATVRRKARKPARTAVRKRKR